MSTPTMYSVEEIAAAREWLIDCFPDQKEQINKADAKLIWANIRLHYEGGIAGFLLSM